MILRRRQNYADWVEDAKGALGYGRSAALMISGNPAEIVEWLAIETAYAPPIFIEYPFQSKGEEETGTIAGVMKPQITIKMRGFDPVAYAPYGEPGPTRWPYVQAGLIVAGALVLRGLLR